MNDFQRSQHAKVSILTDNSYSKVGFDVFLITELFQTLSLITFEFFNLLLYSNNSFT